MIGDLAGFPDGELIDELARRLGIEGIATGRGAAAPLGPQLDAAPAGVRRLRLFEGIRAELAAIAAVDAEVPRIGEPAPEPGTGAPTEEGTESPLIAIARAAGRAAAQKRAGRIEVVPVIHRPRGYGTKQWFVVDTPCAAVEADTGGTLRPSRGIVHGSFADAEGYVSLPGERRLAPEAIFCGFVSLPEAEAYWEAASPGVPAPRLPRRRFA